MSVHLRDVELVGHDAAGLDGAVGDGDDLAVVHALEAGDVAVADVASGADETNPDWFLRHCFPPG